MTTLSRMPEHKRGGAQLLKAALKELVPLSSLRVIDLWSAFSTDAYHASWLDVPEDFEGMLLSRFRAWLQSDDDWSTDFRGGVDS